jgi:hypothetical protein
MNTTDLLRTAEKARRLANWLNGSDAALLRKLADEYEMTAHSQIGAAREARPDAVACSSMRCKPEREKGSG